MTSLYAFSTFFLALVSTELARYKSHYYYYFLAHQHKACRREYETKQCSNGCNDISFGCQCVLEGDRIPSLKSHGQALKQERCLPGLFLLLL